MSKTTLIHIAERILNTPLLIHPMKAEIIFSILQDRLGDGVSLDLDFDMKSPEASRFIGSQDRSERKMGLAQAHNGVANISIIGSLVNRGAYLGANSGMTSYEGLGAQFDDVAGDSEIHSVIMDIDSPGGEALGMFGLAAKIREVRKAKRIIAVVNDMAASAAYGLAAGADQIVVSPTSMLGSIGVVMMHMDRSGELAKRGIKSTLLYKGSHKVDGNSFGPLTDEVKADMQAVVDQFYEQFIATVDAGRGERFDAKAARATEAQTYIGAEAVKLGMADRIGTFAEVLNELVSSQRNGRITSSRRTLMETNVKDAPVVVTGHTTEHMNAEIAKAVAEATAKFTKVGAEAERTRIVAIMRSEPAKGREAQALAFALDTTISAEEANKVLAASPLAAPPTAPVKTVAERAAANLGQIGADEDNTPEGKAAAMATAKAGWNTAVEAVNSRIVKH